MTEDEKYMQRCIQLALNGRLNARPNPMVGAVIVADGRIIGEGYHVRCGEGHAEVNAIASVRERHLLPQSTIYVSLEPCAHYGKTPPCADLIIHTGIPRVVIGCADPFAKVNGLGIKKLKDAGIRVTVGVLEEACRELNRPFMTFHTHHRPFITLKWAQSRDGFLDFKRTPFDKQKPAIFSTPVTQALVHKRRAEHAAILVGYNTALLDNPTLTTRYWTWPSPLRIVIDEEGALPHSLNLFDGTKPTLVFTKNASPAYAGKANVDIYLLKGNAPLLEEIMEVLYTRNIQSLLVEGGAKTLQAFIDAGLWDDTFIETADIHLGEGVKVPAMA